MKDKEFVVWLCGAIVVLAAICIAAGSSNTAPPVKASKDHLQWEEVGSYTYRASVHGGWIYRYYHDTLVFVPEQGIATK